MARPVVLSAAPAVGLAASSGTECEIAADGAAFAQAVSALLEPPERGGPMGVAARDCVLRAYSWPAHLALLDQLLGVAQSAPAHDGVQAVEAEPAALRFRGKLS